MPFAPDLPPGLPATAPGLPLGFLVVAAALLIALFPGCTSRRQRPPVILISIDTCRADHLGCYGYARPGTPNLDAFSRDAVLFTRAESPIPMTLPAHCSMMTGLLPPEHGVRDNLSYRLADSKTTLAEILRDAGYTTGAVIGAFVLDSRFHLDQGFQDYDDRIETPRGGVASLNERKAEAVTRLGLDWIAAHASGRERTAASGRSSAAVPFFLFLHYYDAHIPYAPPEPFATTFRDDPYAGEISYVDSEIGRIFDDLKDRGLYDKSLIIVVGDHGESLGEHGEKTHEYFIYQSTLHIPIMIKAPGARGNGANAHAAKTPAANAGRRDDRPASLVDILPTTLRACGLTPPAGLSGEDLLAPPPEKGKERTLYAESLAATKYGCSPLKAAIIGDWKYIETASPELYNLAQDPNEAANLMAKEPQRAKSMAETLRAFMAAHADSAAGGRIVPDEETRQRLESLGYLAGHAVEENAGLGGPDPKDFIEAHEDFQDALDLVSRRDYDQARSLCARILAEQPAMTDVYILLGDIEYENHRPAEAMAQYRKYLEVSSAARKPGNAPEALSPNTARAHYDLGNALADLGRKDEALSEYREALRINPAHIDARFNLALTLAQTGNVDQAINEFGEVLKIKSDWPEAHYNLGRALFLRGRLEEAVPHLNEALRLRPSYAEAETALGDAMAVQGKLAEAVPHYENAVRLRPDLPDARLSLAHGYLRLRQINRALEVYRSLVQAFPDWPVPLNELAWILATHEDAHVRNGAEAVRLAEAANAKTGYKDPALLETLAAGYAEVGRFSDAVRIEEKALQQVKAQPAPAGAAPAGATPGAPSIEARAAGMQERIEQYRQQHRTRSRF